MSNKNVVSSFLAALLLFTPVFSAVAQNSQGQNTPGTNLLTEFRPIGGSGNNLVHPNLNTPPGTPELAIAPLNFAPGTNDKTGPVCSTCGKSLEYLTQTATDIILLVINQVIRQNR
jgi:hypothetical protein